MVYSPDVVTRTVFGQYLQSDGNPATGKVTITPSTQVRDLSDSIILPRAIITTLDENGEFSVELPCTDNINLTPVNWFYTARTRTSGAAPTSFRFYLPQADGVSVDISTLDQTSLYSPPVLAGSLPTKAVEVYTFTFSGGLREYVGTGRLYLEGPYVLINTRLAVGETADRDIIINIKKNGSSIFETPQTIPAGEHTSVSDDGSTATFNKNDYITFDIVQAGITETGRDLTATIRLKRLF